MHAGVLVGPGRERRGTSAGDMTDELPDPRSGREAAPRRLRARMPGRFTRLRKCRDG
ncbi:hypothetical protein M9458_052060, partial [Cirrhinus mrigala]